MATRVLEHDGDPSVGKRLKAVGYDVAVPCPISHHDDELGGLGLDGMLFPVERAAVENGGFGEVVSGVRHGSDDAIHRLPRPSRVRRPEARLSRSGWSMPTSARPLPLDVVAAITWHALSHRGRVVRRLSMVDQHFPYAVDRRFLPLLLPFGFHASSDGATVTDDGDFTVTFGFLTLRTRTENIAGAHVTTKYRWWTAIGARRSMADDGLTFGSNANAGVCIHFRDPVPSLLRRAGHSALTVTVADLEGLVHAIRC